MLSVTGCLSLSICIISWTTMLVLKFPWWAIAYGTLTCQTRWKIQHSAIFYMFVLFSCAWIKVNYAISTVTVVIESCICCYLLCLYSYWKSVWYSEIPCIFLFSNCLLVRICLPFKEADSNETTDLQQLHKAQQTVTILFLRLISWS